MIVGDYQNDTYIEYNFAFDQMSIFQEQKNYRYLSKRADFP